MNLHWKPPAEWPVIRTIEAHTAGEPLRIIVDGLPPIPGDTILAKRNYARRHLDHLRTTLMWEPRGHADMYGAIPVEPVTPDGDLGVLFLHNEGFSTMCGHGIIALATVLLETGMIVREGDAPVLRIDTPAGRVTARARREEGRIARVAFENVPSFVYAAARRVDVPGIGPIPYTVAFGGAFYAFVEAADLDVGLDPSDFRRLIDLGTRIKHAVMADLPLVHPDAEDLSFLYGTILTGPAQDPAHHSRNVCVFADGEVDRSPTGTGVSARAAIHYARGDVALDEPFTVESILGTTMTGRAVRESHVGTFPAVIPTVTGQASIVGQAEWCVDPNDPLRHGFILR
ncbi:MAG: proline racemase family protein [Acidobacteria bacterium]|nr:proline racemase family protein [Acidobacteriota bacterium]